MQCCTGDCDAGVQLLIEGVGFVKSIVLYLSFF